jgi:acetoin utilization deacetylase AcuC-like enzyme
MNTKFATYLHPQTCLTSKPVDQIRFVGQSLPHFNNVRAAVANALDNYPSIPPVQAGFEEFYRVHDKTYLDKLQQMARNEPITEPPKLSLECTGLEHAIPGYRYSLGGLYEAIDRMKAGSLERAYCFSLGGHHAHPDWGHGYCLLNPVAASARYAQEQGFGNVLIIDWDHHHGDGTQAIFANDDTVYCLSIHSAMDFYMTSQRVLRQGTTTAAEEVGHCNIPILHKAFDDDSWRQMGLDGAYFRAGQSIPAFQAALEKLPWTPDIVFIFSGYDAHREDCGKNIQEWTNEDFETLTISVLETAKKAGCPILSVHGGGYKLPVTVSAALAHIRILATHE